MSINGRNQLLRKLTNHDLERFAPVLTEEFLPKGRILSSPGSIIDHVYFPINCVCTILAETAGNGSIEVGMVGSEGMSKSLVKPGDKTYFHNVVLVSGSALRASAADFARTFHELPSLNEVTMRYREFSAVQFGYSVAAHGTFTVEARVARWILMAHDRSSSADLPVVHNKIASLLNVRRSGVTTAIHVLEGTGAIKSTRGMMAVRNREKLLELAGDCYGPSERAYEMIMGGRPDQALCRCAEKH